MIIIIITTTVVIIAYIYCGCLCLTERQSALRKGTLDLEHVNVESRHCSSTYSHDSGTRKLLSSRFGSVGRAL